MTMRMKARICLDCRLSAVPRQMHCTRKLQYDMLFLSCRRVAACRGR